MTEKQIERAKTANAAGFINQRVYDAGRSHSDAYQDLQYAYVYQAGITEQIPRIQAMVRSHLGVVNELGSLKGGDLSYEAVVRALDDMVLKNELQPEMARRILEIVWEDKQQSEPVDERIDEPVTTELDTAEALEMWNSASAEERKKITDLAIIHAKFRDAFKTDIERQAYDAGAMAAAQMADDGAFEKASVKKSPSEAVVGALRCMTATGEMPSDLAMKIFLGLSAGEGKTKTLKKDNE